MRTLIKLLGSLRRRGVVLAIMVLCAGNGLAHAQAGTRYDDIDPPSRVARLSWIAGDLGLLPAGARDWSDASLNRPLTSGDRLSSGADARAELEFGGATLRLDRDTDLGLLDLDQQLAQIELTRGTLSLSAHRLEQGQSYEIDTPTVALVIDEPGRVRVQIDGNATQVSVFEGKASVYGENDARRDVYAGRSYRFVDSRLAAIAISDIDGGDDFDIWVDQRDQRYAQSRSSQYVSPDVVGYQDLDQYGDWYDTSLYGAVWYPRNVAVGWAPYRDGRWAYIAPWGWTWIDSMPWGYAPYHYGRWAHTRRGWGWIPGPRYARPIYAPALVAFVGGSGYSVGIGSGPVGWFPLGPGEIYNPWYRCNRDYYRRVNVTNIRLTRNITHVAISHRIDNHYGYYRDNRPLRDVRYANRHAPGGFNAMPGREFAAGQQVRRNLVQVDSHRLDRAQVIPHGIDVRPLPGAGQRSAHVRQLPRGGFQREVVARRAPPVMPERRFDAGRPLAGPQQLAAPGSNVRVLNRSRVEAPERRQPPGEQSPLRRSSNGVVSRPLVQRRQEPVESAYQRALPSARFAHSQSRSRNSEPTAMPRPGVSYMSGGDQERPSLANRNGTSLPQVPRIRRADTDRRAGMERVQESPRGAVGRPRVDAPERSRPRPRFERADATRPAYATDQTRSPRAFRESAPPTALQPRRDPARREQPRYAQAQRVAPAPPRAAPPSTPPQRATPQRAEPQRAAPQQAEVSRSRRSDARQQREP